MKRMTMNSKLKPVFIFCSLVSLGILVRVAFQDIPNFAPVAALALFAGFYFQRTLVAAAVPLLVMAVSDRMVDAGGYSWPLMLTVYGLLALPVLFSNHLRRLVQFEDRNPRKLTGEGLAVGGYSLASSLLFFVGTNAMVWATTSIYPSDLEGLVACYVAAIPFFKYTLTGDLIFGACLFGSLAAFRSAFSTAKEVAPVVEA